MREKKESGSDFMPQKDAIERKLVKTKKSQRKLIQRLKCPRTGEVVHRLRTRVQHTIVQEPLHGRSAKVHSARYRRGQKETFMNGREEKLFCKLKTGYARTLPQVRHKKMKAHKAKKDNFQRQS